MFKADDDTGYLYYSSNTIIMMINILHFKCNGDSDQIPWDYITVLLNDLDDYPEA